MTLSFINLPPFLFSEATTWTPELTVQSHRNRKRPSDDLSPSLRSVSFPSLFRCLFVLLHRLCPPVYLLALAYSLARSLTWPLRRLPSVAPRNTGGHRHRAPWFTATVETFLLSTALGGSPLAQSQTFSTSFQQTLAYACIRSIVSHLTNNAPSAGTRTHPFSRSAQSTLLHFDSDLSI